MMTCKRLTNFLGGATVQIWDIFSILAYSEAFEVLGKFLFLRLVVPSTPGNVKR